MSLPLSCAVNMPIDMSFKILVSKKPVICPECKGEGEKMYYNDDEHCNIDEKCRLCGGDMIMVETVIAEYERHAQAWKSKKNLRG